MYIGEEKGGREREEGEREREKEGIRIEIGWRNDWLLVLKFKLSLACAGASVWDWMRGRPNWKP